MRSHSGFFFVAVYMSLLLWFVNLTPRTFCTHPWHDRRGLYTHKCHSSLSSESNKRYRMLVRTLVFIVLWPCYELHLAPWTVV